MAEAKCKNCGAVLSGPFCAACGQHAHESARSIGVLFHDAWHILTHVDGRLWRTLYSLLLQPGRLTVDYFADRRARYLPPVRLYLVLSVLFFALGTTNAGGRFDPDATARNSASSVNGENGATVTKRPVDSGFTFDTRDCDKITSSFAWLQKPLRQGCQRNLAMGGAPLRDAFAANIPKMMFVFLPLMALCMLLLYWRPRHYYVEHLVFFLHTHAAMFLILLLKRPLAWILTSLAGRSLAGVLTLAAGVYAAWYIYKAMRVYYGQGRWLTLAKLALVTCAYLVFLSVTLVATLVVSALTA